MEDFLDRLERLKISDVGKESVEDLKRESQGDRDKERMLQLMLGKLEQLAGLDQKVTELDQKVTEGDQKVVERDQKVDGTFLEDCDRLWVVAHHELPQEEGGRLDLFDKI